MSNQRDKFIASILVVDDTIENLRLLTKILAEHGYDVRPFPSGRQALKSVENERPDLILLDISMPDMDGFEVCQSLKASANASDIPVIFLTAYTDTTHKVRAFELGGVDYITKPFQVEEVLARVETHIALRRSQLKLAESYEHLRALEKLRDDLVHMVVHDMRSPLTTLRIRLDILKLSDNDLDDDLREDLDEAIQSVSVLSRMANDLIDISRLERGNLPLDLASCDLNRLSLDVVKSLGALDRARNIEIECQGNVEARCDSAIVRRVIENLLDNCLKHTPEGSPIRIEISGNESTSRVAVHDGGPGVAPEERERIFEKFGTVVANRAKRRHSAGLGLSFCKLAIEAHDGSIGIAPGEPAGSIFWFEIPARSRDQQPAR